MESRQSPVGCSRPNQHSHRLPFHQLYAVATTHTTEACCLQVWIERERQLPRCIMGIHFTATTKLITSTEGREKRRRQPAAVSECGFVAWRAHGRR